MSTFEGLPAHVLLVHFIVVLVPLTAILAIVCALWPAARSRLTWLVLILATVTTVLTPVATDAGEWLERRTPPNALLHAHAELGDTMLYFAIGLLAAAVLLTLVHLREGRDHSLQPLVKGVVVAVVVVASIAAAVQVYRIGDSGAQSVWGNEAAAPASPN